MWPYSLSVLQTPEPCISGKLQPFLFCFETEIHRCNLKNEHGKKICNRKVNSSPLIFLFNPELSTLFLRGNHSYQFLVSLSRDIYMSHTHTHVHISICFFLNNLSTHYVLSASYPVLVFWPCLSLLLTSVHHHGHCHRKLSSSLFEISYV
jgi:hypothetical protein